MMSTRTAFRGLVVAKYFMKQSVCEFGWSGSLPGRATGAVGNPAETRKDRGDMVRYLDIVGVSGRYATATLLS
jgi:hypothetical protein